ncbi:MAG TPA: ATP-binding protein [Chitinophagales bacterium]|nr:ATP-binding protein [Chitinophagales bacterium]HRP38075.1 ATP-binding protein [Chitinophagales bacterium]
MNQIKKIAIVGTESTGKSTLAEMLARQFNTIFVPEISRSYLETISRKWNYEDVLKIAELQLKKEDELCSNTNKFLFCDTEMICIKVWLEFYSLEVPKWIIQEIENRTYSHFFLMDIDLPWIADNLRENPHNRLQLFDAFKYELNFFKKPFTIISGTNEERTKHASDIVLSL